MRPIDQGVMDTSNITITMTISMTQDHSHQNDQIDDHHHNGDLGAAVMTRDGSHGASWHSAGLQ